jgi:hypothetical protein
MRFDFWNKLFKECNYFKNCYNQIKIGKLIILGILNKKEKINLVIQISLFMNLNMK